MLDINWNVCKVFLYSKCFDSIDIHNY